MKTAVPQWDPQHSLQVADLVSPPHGAGSPNGGVIGTVQVWSPLTSRLRGGTDTGVGRLTWLQGSTCHSSQGSTLQLTLGGGGLPARTWQWNGLRLRWSRLSTHWTCRVWTPPLQSLEHCVETEKGA